MALKPLSAAALPAPFDAARRPRGNAAEAAPLQASGAQAAPEQTGPPPSLPKRRSFWARYRLLLLSVTALLIVGGAAVGLWYALPIKAVQISGNRHLSPLEVKQLAGLSGDRPFGWLYYGAWRAAALRDNPWVAQAQLTRIYPDRVELRIEERVPAAQVRSRDGSLRVIAADATALPGAAPTGPVISGWGPERLDDALFAARALSRYNVESVTYTPTGITVQTSQGTIWSGDTALLLKYGQAIETQAPGGRINLYPWGVSVQR